MRRSNMATEFKFKEKTRIYPGRYTDSKTHKVDAGIMGQRVLQVILPHQKHLPFRGFHGTLVILHPRSSSTCARGI